ncbi:LLM class F420-dependent oxidoreductase [Leifsonia kafniensis]|uniref:LLM class F420-dependent oxidoreductase n=1 Tax=Leifsonia kafniensis TaxID=475957 RepID=A0ABP7KQC0_9MICO
MEIGINVGGFNADTERPDNVARKIEDAGFDALVLGEHIHSVGNLEQHPPSSFELFTVFALAANATERLRVGSGIMQLGMRDPILTAKQAATIAALSGNRIDLIVATGSVSEEMRNHGTNPEQVRDVLRERMLAMREIFNNETSSFNGEFVKFDEASVGPRDTDGRIHVPVLLGAGFDGIGERVAEAADGWAMWPWDESGVAQAKEFKAAHPDKLLHVYGVESADDLAAYREAGADRVNLGLWDLTPGAVDAQLADLRTLVDSAS